MKMSVELIDAVIDTNLRGPYILACDVARRLIADPVPRLSSVAAAWRAELGL